MSPSATETSSLLQNTAASCHSSSSASLCDDLVHPSTIPTPRKSKYSPLRQEAHAWLAIACPSVFSVIAQNIPNVCTLAFLGQMSTSALAAVALTQVWIYGLAFTLWVALGITQASVTSQAAGSGKGVAVRGLLWITLTFGLAITCLIAVLFFFTDQTFQGLGYDHLDMDVVRLYSRYSIPVLFLITLYNPLSGRLVAQQIVFIPFCIDVAIAVTDIALSYAFILPLGYGVLGAVMANIVASFVGLVLYLLAHWRHPAENYVHLMEDAESPEEVEIKEDEEALVLLKQTTSDVVGNVGNVQEVGKPSEEALLVVAELTLTQFLSSRAPWRMFASQLSANLVTIAMEIGQRIIVSFLAASYGQVTTAAHNVTSELFELFSSVLYGFSDATCVRVGFHVGRDRERDGKRAALVSVLASGIWSLFVAAVFLAAHPWLGSLFSTDAAVSAMISELLLYASAYYVVYSLYIGTASVLDGQGRATINPLVSAVGSVGLTLLIAILFQKFTDLGVPGLWIAQIIGNAASAVAAAYLVVMSRWHELSQRIRSL
jgi:Na+-driven multidrug efflux pump